MSEDFWIGPPTDPDRIRLGPAVASGSEGVLYRGSATVPSGVLEMAVKMLQPGHLRRLDAWRQLWKEQVELLQDVQVPGLVRVRRGFVGPLPHLRGRADRSTSTLYLLMDWIEGVSLDAWAQTLDSPRPEQLLQALVPVAAALDLLHSGAATAGVPVVHRDVKPANILVRPDGSTVLVDVGSLGGLSRGMQQSGVAGTAGYIAPEVRGDAVYTPAADRYSLGAVAYFLLVGEEPPVHGNTYELRGRLLVAPIIAGRQDVAEHVLAMLDPVPENRPAFLANWVAQLRRSSLVALTGDVAPPRAPSRNPDPPPPAELIAASRSQPEIDPATTGATRRRRAVRVGAVVVVVAMVIGLGLVDRRGTSLGPTQFEAAGDTALESTTEPPDTSTTTAPGTTTSVQSVTTIDTGARPGADRLSTTTTTVIAASQPAAPSAADLRGKIAFVRRVGQTSNPMIYLMNPDGSAQTLWTETLAADDLRWSPDGTRLAFSDGFDIRVLSAGGGPAQRITKDTTENRGPAWSPDGTKIAFSGTKNNEVGIYIINADGSGASRRVGSESGGGPSWSPDGKKIAYVTFDSAMGSIVTINVDGSPAPTKLATGYVTAAAWSPDGRKLLFRQYPSIVTINADGGGLQTLATWPGTIPSPDNGDAAEPSWSPDGTRIVLTVSKRDGTCRIATMLADGSGRSELPGPATCDSSPTWNR